MCKNVKIHILEHCGQLMRLCTISAELRLNKARGNIWSRPQACRATNLNLGSSHRVALNEY